jgi:hypothetical protein
MNQYDPQTPGVLFLVPPQLPSTNFLNPKPGFRVFEVGCIAAVAHVSATMPVIRKEANTIFLIVDLEIQPYNIPEIQNLRHWMEKYVAYPELGSLIFSHERISRILGKRPKPEVVAAYATPQGLVPVGHQPPGKPMYWNNPKRRVWHTHFDKSSSLLVKQVLASSHPMSMNDGHLILNTGLEPILDLESGVSIYTPLAEPMWGVAQAELYLSGGQVRHITIVGDQSAYDEVFAHLKATKAFKVQQDQHVLENPYRANGSIHH